MRRTVLAAWVVFAFMLQPGIGAAQSTAMTPEQVAALSPDDAQAAVDAMFDEFIDTMQSRCAGAAAGDACLNQQYESALDPAGAFTAFCRVHADNKEYRLCLVVAAESTPMVSAAGGNLEADIEWSNIDDMNNEARKQFMSAVLPKCGTRKACIIEQMVSLLLLPAPVAESCQDHGKFLNQLNCISNAIAAVVYRRALDAKT